MLLLNYHPITRLKPTKLKANNFIKCIINIDIIKISYTSTLLVLFMPTQMMSFY